MIKKILGASLFVLASVGFAHADMATAFSSKYWEVQYGTLDNGVEACSLTTPMTGAYFGIKYMASQPDKFIIHLSNVDWEAPAGTQVPVKIRFDNRSGGSITMVSSHTNSGLTFLEGHADIIDGSATSLLEGIAQSNKMGIFFGQRVRPWYLNMGGSKVAAMKFLECVQAVLHRTVPSANSTGKAKYTNISY